MPWNWKNVLVSMAKLFLPLHQAFRKRPLYTLIRYIFHICMIVVPIGLYGHIVMVESSALQLSWPALPDGWTDWMTIIFIVLALGFLVRRSVIADVRQKSSAFDYVFIVITVLPFISGYFLAHGTLDSIPFFMDNLLTIHILNALTMVFMAIFLFLRSRLDQKTCTGCTACELECPTGTLEAHDEGAQRIFSYSHYLCISCGACISACPENAAELRHEMGFLKFFQVLLKQKIRSVDLKTCQRCGALFAPEPQWDKLARDVSDDYLHFCSACKKHNYANSLRLPKFSG